MSKKEELENQGDDGIKISLSTILIISFFMITISISIWYFYDFTNSGSTIREKYYSYGKSDKTDFEETQNKLVL